MRKTPLKDESIRITNQPAALAGEKIGAHISARLLYFCYYMAIGAFLPFINLYYDRIGLNGVQIGTLSALPVLVMSPVAPLWGLIADTFRLHRGLLRGALLLAPLAIFLLSRTTHYPALVALVLVYAVVSAPIIPLLDSAALEASERHQRSYGELRVWGTIGWALSTWLVGTLIHRFDIYWLFYSYLAFMGFTLLSSIFQPARMKTLQSPLQYSLRRLITNRVLLLFLFGIFLLTITTGGVNYFFSLYMDRIGADERLIGLAWTIAAISEVPVMIWSGFIMRNIQARGLLLLAFIVYILRWLLYSFISAPGWVLVVQLLHGLSFASFLVGGVTYINAYTPEGLSTSAQAIFNAVSFGIGPFVGALLGGFLYDALGITAMFRVFTLIAFLGLMVFYGSGRYTYRRRNG